MGKRQSGIVIPKKATLGQRFLGFSIWAALKALYATMRIRWHDETGLLRELPGEQVIFCIWHNRLGTAAAVYQLYVLKHNPNRVLAPMISASGDGALLTDVLRRFGMHPIRGSSSRRGPQALLEMARLTKDGFDLAVTPDGPRGPLYTLHEGIVSLAQVTGLPIIPSSSRIAWRKDLRSWDRFQIPLPFTACDIFLGKPIRVPRRMSDEEREAISDQLKKALMDLTDD